MPEWAVLNSLHIGFSPSPFACTLGVLAKGHISWSGFSRILGKNRSGVNGNGRIGTRYRTWMLAGRVVRTDKLFIESARAAKHPQSNGCRHRRHAVPRRGYPGLTGHRLAMAARGPDGLAGRFFCDLPRRTCDRNPVFPQEATPSGITPSGITPSGITPSGITPSGIIPCRKMLSYRTT